MVGFAAASALVPGLGQALQRRWLAAAVFGVQTAAVILLIARIAAQDKVTLVRWTVDSTVLHVLSIGGVVWAIVCALAAVDAGRAGRPRGVALDRRRAVARGGIAAVAMLALVPGVAVAAIAMRQNSVLDTVFSSSGSAVAEPSPLSDLGVTTTTAKPARSRPTTATTAGRAHPVSSAAPPRAMPAATLPPAPNRGRWTVALLGGDAGPHRWGLRTDTMIVISVDRATGSVDVISVPRNLERLPMPPGPLRARFPSGFNDLANALYPYVATHPDLGLDPAQAVKGSLAELLGIPIDNYVLVDMAGFIKIIDALGGVTVTLSKRVPLVPNIDGKTIEARSVGPGTIHMNGAMALAFSRTRELDSDYARMRRQRCLLDALAHGMSASALAGSYLRLASAVENSFRSDIPRDQLGELVDLFARIDVAHSRALALTPPVIKPGHPDIGRVRDLVSQSLVPSTASSNPAITSPAC
jgi:LCP family protein required for cell wall assembly